MPNLVFEADAATRRVLGLTSVAAPLNLESAKRDAREEATLSIAKEANRIASEALLVATDSAASAFEQARWAKWAAILAAIAALIATKDQIISLVMSWFSN